MAIDPVPNTSEVLSRDGKPSRVWFLWFSQLREQVNSVVGGWVPAARKILTSLPLRGGGDLSQDRTLSVDVARANSVGVVKPDGVSTTVSPDGTLSAIAASSRPSGPAGGDLTGLYPNPSIRPGLIPNFSDNEIVAGAGNNWALAESPLGVPLLFVILPGFGMIGLVKDSAAAYGYTLAGNAIVTVSAYSAGDLHAWYRY